MNSSYIEIFPTTTCPTCQGKKVIPKNNKSGYIALIPAGDKRLKPARICLKATFAVAIVLLITFIILFFLIRRSVVLLSNHDPITDTKVVMYNATRTTILKFIKKFNITNNNYLPFNVRSIDVTYVLEEKAYNPPSVKTDIYLGIHSTKELSYKIDTTFTDDVTDLQFVCSYSNPAFTYVSYLFNIVISGDVLGQTIQATVSVLQMVYCGNGTYIYNL